jgi:CBS domain-containing protein
MEQTLSTDQDNAIIYENITGARAEKVNEYFLQLGSRVNEMLAEAGFTSCKGGNMAGNPKWCQPLDTWKKYFSDWIRMPGPEELLEISIFFDFRFCYGNPELSEELKEFILKGLRTSDIFFHHMASAWKQFSVFVNVVPSGKSDIKKMLMPLVGISRLYALRHSVQTCSTIERLIGLHAGDNLDQKMMHDLIKAWKDLTSIRLAHQINCMNRGQEPDNYVDFHALSSDSSYFAGRALVSINNLLLKAGNDFYIETI